MPLRSYIPFVVPVAAVALVALVSCRRAGRLPARDAHSFAAPIDAGRDGLAAETPDLDAPVFGPPNPWGDGSLPPSTATGPDVDRAHACMTSLVASIGFWRVVRHRRGGCPTFGDLRSTAGSSFDPATMATDPWQSPYEIQCQGSRLRIRSFGPDRTADTVDDVWSQ